MRLKHRKIVRKKRLQTRQDRIMTLANAISISRIVLAIPLVLLFEDISRGNERLAFTVNFNQDINILEKN